MDALNSAIVLLNHWGLVSCDFAERMLIQSSILIGLLLLADLCLRARACARFRYAMWLLVLVKLMLPPSLALPTGVTYWLGRYLPAVPTVSPPSASAVFPSSPASVEYLGHSLPMPAPVVEAAVPGSRLVSLQWPGLLLLVWVAGALLLLALVLRRVASVRRALCRRSRPPSPSP